MKLEPAIIDLANRPGLPEDLCHLARRYPRDGWRQHENIGGMASFWLQRHDMFREVGTLLATAISQHREGTTTPQEFARFMVPRLNFFLGNLEGHHQVEDQHYFPVFAEAEPRLKHGFEILDADHHLIHDALAANAEAANAFLQALHGDADSQRFAADAYGDANTALVAMLTRHLADEEDLIIPLILDRGDGGLGIG